MSKSGILVAKSRKRQMPQNKHLSGFRGPNPDVGKATQFQPGESGNPGGRPKALISDATRDWLKEIDPETGKTNAVLVAEAQGKKALDGETSSYNALADRTEGKPAQTQQHEVISHDPIKVEIDAPDLISTLRAIYGLSRDSGKST
jgi:hypothetical protein